MAKKQSWKALEMAVAPLFSMSLDALLELTSKTFQVVLLTVTFAGIVHAD